MFYCEPVMTLNLSACLPHPFNPITKQRFNTDNDCLFTGINIMHTKEERK